MAEGERVKLFVGQVPKQMTESQLLRMFQESIVANEVNIIKDRVTRASRGLIACYASVTLCGNRNVRFQGCFNLFYWNLWLISIFNCGLGWLAGCCFLFCPSREEAEKAINIFHDKKTLPGVGIVTFFNFLMHQHRSVRLARLFPTFLMPFWDYSTCW